VGVRLLEIRVQSFASIVDRRYLHLFTYQGIHPDQHAKWVACGLPSPLPKGLLSRGADNASSSVTAVAYYADSQFGPPREHDPLTDHYFLRTVETFLLA
jgi:hypothetical protein